MIQIDISKKAKKYYKKIVKSNMNTTFFNAYKTLYEDEYGNILDEEINRSVFKAAKGRGLAIGEDIFFIFTHEDIVYEFMITDQVVKVLARTKEVTGPSIDKVLDINMSSKLDTRDLISLTLEGAKGLEKELTNDDVINDSKQKLFSKESFINVLLQPYKDYKKIIISGTIASVLFLVFLFMTMGLPKPKDYLTIVPFVVLVAALILVYVSKIIKIKGFLKKLSNEDKLVEVKGKITDCILLQKNLSGVNVLYGIIVKINNKKYLIALPSYVLFDKHQTQEIKNLLLGRDEVFNAYETSNVINLLDHPLENKILNLEDLD